MNKKCLSCGCEKLEVGKVQSTGKMYFRPKKAKFLSFKSSNIIVKGQICTKCGHVMLFANEKKVAEMILNKKNK